MSETIDSIIRIQHSTGQDVIGILEKFKKTQDVPYDAIEYTQIDETEFEITIKYAQNIFDKSITQFLAILYGELPFMRGFGRLRFTGLNLPEAVYRWFRGPKFGVDGIRKRWQMDDLPFLMCILKPSIDFNATRANQLERIKEPLLGGFHAVKDDEIGGNMSHLSLADKRFMAQECPGYVPVVNLDDLNMYRELCLDWHPQMFMVNASIIGFPMLSRITAISSAPILSHLALQGSFHQTFSPWLYAFLHRLFGCDAFITAIGDSGYYCADKKDEKEMVTALTDELPIKRTLPILTGGARIHNLERLISGYEQNKTPYGVVFGSLFFYEKESAAEVASKVVRTICDIQKKVRSSASARWETVV